MAKQKTPMQQLLEKLEFVRQQIKTDVLITDKDFKDGYLGAILNIISDIELQMLPIEETVIRKAFSDGMSDLGDIYSDKHYYNEKFIEETDTTAHLVNKHGQLDEAGAYADDDID